MEFLNDEFGRSPLAEGNLNAISDGLWACLPG
jgi:hypothetical protein